MEVIPDKKSATEYTASSSESIIEPEGNRLSAAADVNESILDVAGISISEENESSSSADTSYVVVNDDDIEKSIKLLESKSEDFLQNEERIQEGKSKKNPNLCLSRTNKSTFDDVSYDGDIDLSPSTADTNILSEWDPFSIQVNVS